MNTTRSVEGLGPKLQPQEIEQIHSAVAAATEACDSGDSQRIAASLREMESAAGIIGRAMFRP